jgi:hypothetical protein
MQHWWNDSDGGAVGTIKVLRENRVPVPLWRPHIQYGIICGTRGQTDTGTGFSPNQVNAILIHVSPK